MQFKQFTKRMRDWYRGKRVGMSDADGVYVSGHIDRPWLAKFVDFICLEYKWITGILIALLMAYLAFRRR